MSTGQEPIREFPEDGAFWFVKWIDEFRIPHRGTASASVAVILQKLPFQDLSELSNLSHERLLQILGQRLRDSDVEVLAPNPLVMPGTLPMLNIGAIFCNKVRVGELPTTSKRLELASGGQEGDEITLGEKLTSPPNWPGSGDYRLLNKYEYSIAPLRMSRSRCLVIRRPTQTIIIPRMTIFKAFYAPHTELAKAFCNGPWELRYSDVICMIDFKSGLKTEKTPSGQWNVILQPKVPDAFADLLALFYFDEFARACASSIHSINFQDRSGRNGDPGYASAKIPFHDATDQKLLLDVRCFQLRSWKYRDNNGKDVEHKKFLVTDVVGSSWPNYIPQIGYERANSGNASPNPTKVEGSAPFRNAAQGKQGDTKTEIDGEHDAHANSSTVHMSATEFGWINKPDKIKITKKSSKQYSDKSPVSAVTDSDKISTGEHTYKQDALGKGEAEIRVREPDKRFQYILEAFEKLTQDGSIDTFDIVPCTISGKQVRRGSLDCWSFSHTPALGKKCRPRRNWRWVEYDKNSLDNCIYRTALVVRLTVGEKVCYWIEIECRKKGEGFRSPLLSNVDEDSAEVILAALDMIVEKKGLKLKGYLNAQLKGFGVHADCYKHIHESASSSEFDVASIQRFLVDAVYSSNADTLFQLY